MNAVDQAARSLEAVLLPLMRSRLEKLGIDESGAYNFYRSRLEMDRALCDYEIKLAQAIAERLASIAEIHEIGCGWGQLVFLLAWCGFKSTGFEVDERRFRGAESLLDALGNGGRDGADRAWLRFESFPPLDRPPPGSLVVATNIVVSNPELIEEHVAWALRRYKYAIIDVDRFCRERQPADRPALFTLVEQAGLTNSGLFCDAGSDGQFYLFERKMTEALGG